MKARNFNKSNVNIFKKIIYILRCNKFYHAFILLLVGVPALRVGCGVLYTMKGMLHMITLLAISTSADLEILGRGFLTTASGISQLSIMVTISFYHPLI